MNKNLKIILYGIVMWLAPFVVSFLIYPLKQSANPFFEALMPVVVTATAVLLALQYFKPVKKDFLREGILIGVSWFVICVALDLMMFLPASPMQMSLQAYMMDIGFTYLIIPLVTMGMGYIADAKLKIGG